MNMKTKVYFQRIPLEEENVIEFDPITFFIQCPGGFEANQSTLKYNFTDTHLILSCDIYQKQPSAAPMNLDDLHPTFDL